MAAAPRASASGSAALRAPNAGHRWSELTTKAVVWRHMDSLAAASQTRDEMQVMRMRSREFPMKWSRDNLSANCLVSQDQLSVRFHPCQAESTTVCLASEPLARTVRYYYWEVRVLDKAYGTSVMFGLCTKKQPLNKPDYWNLIGLDEHGWSLSHKGLVWHAGASRPYTAPFTPYGPVTVGLELNVISGELSYYMNGRNLGVAFFGLNETQEDLYPCVGSTAKNITMVLLGAYRAHESLLDRSCFSILMHCPDHLRLFEHLENNYRLPAHLIEELKRSASSGHERDEAAARASDNFKPLNESPLFGAPLDLPLVANLHLQYAE